METKVVPVIKALTFTFETTFKMMMEDVGNIPSVIEEKAVEAGFTPEGPQIWLYHDCDAEMKKPFRLTIAKPVSGAGDVSGGYKLEELPEIKVISTIHKGEWNKLCETYTTIMEEIQKTGLKVAGSSREVYQYFDMENPEKNITEVQVEIY